MGPTRDQQTSTPQPLTSTPPNTSQSRVRRGPTIVSQRVFRGSRGGVLTCGSRGRAARAAGRGFRLRVAAGAVRGLRRLFPSAPGGGRLGAFAGHGRWGRGRARGKSARRAAGQYRYIPRWSPRRMGSAPTPSHSGEKLCPFPRAQFKIRRSTPAVCSVKKARKTQVPKRQDSF